VADNIQVTQGVGTIMATDDISGVQYPRVKLSWGADGSAVDASATNPLPGYAPNSEVVLSASFTRPADTIAYAAGDLAANSTTAGSVVPLSFASAVRVAGDCLRVERIRIEKTSTSLTNASFRVHLFEASPSVTVGDNGVFNSSGTLATGTILSHAGSAPITMVWAGTDGAIGIGLPTTGSGMTVRPSSGTTIYALVEVTAAYTPVSGETFTVILEGYRT